MYDGNVVITNIGLDYSTLLLFLLDFQQIIVSKTVPTTQCMDVDINIL